MRNKKKTFLSLALAVAIGLSAGAGIITQKSSADDNLESFAQAQTATETITPKQYENFKQYNEGDLTPTNSFKSAETVPTLDKDVSLHLKINIPVRCSLDIYAKYVGDNNSSDEIYGSLYNASGVKQDTHNVLEPGLYYYAAGRLSSYEENPVWKVYAHYLPVGEELTEDGQKYIAYGKGDRLNKVLPEDTVGKITYADGPTTYKFVAKAPGAVYMELFDEYGNGEIKYIEDAEFALYDSKMKLIAKQPNKTEDYKRRNGTLNLDRVWEGVTFNVKKKGTYYLKMTNYKGAFAYHMSFAKGLSIKALMMTNAYILPANPSKIIKGCMKYAYIGGTNNLYINEPPLMAACITNLSDKDRKTNIIKWGKVKTAQKYMIRRIYTYEKNKKTVKVKYKKKYTKKTYFKMTKKDMQGRKQIYVEIRPVRNGKFGPTIQLASKRKGSCVVVRNTKGKITMSLTNDGTPFH